ncbi:MAG: hypothetical protein ABWY52_06715 [Candidatus Limnocylindrales bacterium]
MPALEGVRGLRVVAEPAALDGARWVNPMDAEVTVLRVAPDEVIAIGALEVQLDDDHAIVAEEHGLVSVWCELSDVAAHLEWSLPVERPTFTQGAVAGVPAKLWLPGGERALLITAAAYAHELTDRLGWLP